MRIRKAVIPAAGWGTRFLPATKSQPKEMLPLIDKPIIQYVVEEAIASGIEDILIVTGRGKRAIEDHFDRSIELETFLANSSDPSRVELVRDLGNMVNVHFIRQKEQLGLGHAIYQAHQHVGDEPFAVLLGDEVFLGKTPCLAQLMAFHAEVGGSVVGVHAVPPEDVHRYGIIDSKLIGPNRYAAVDLVEKPSQEDAPSNLAIIGRYVLDPGVFDVLEHLPAGRNGEIQLTDGLRILNQDRPVYAYAPDTRRYDVGEKLGFLKATVELALVRPDLHQEFDEFLRDLVRGERV